MPLRYFPNFVFGVLTICATIAGPAFGQTPVPSAAQASSAPSTPDPPPPVPPEVVRRDQMGRVSIRAVRVTEPVRVDGLLDEETYQSTTPVDGFIQQEPREGEPGSEPTEAWILFDDKNIYIAARCYDSQPERMVINEMRRDNGNIYQNENFTVALDTYHDKRNGYYFQVSAIGALRDGLVTDEGNPNYDWNAVHDARVVRSDQGYTLEMVIPFKSLRYSAGPGQVWGINLRRTVRWKNEDMFITRMPSSYGSSAIYKFSSAATLVGLETPATSRTATDGSKPARSRRRSRSSARTAIALRSSTPTATNTSPIRSRFRRASRSRPAATTSRRSARPTPWALSIACRARPPSL